MQIPTHPEENRDLEIILKNLSDLKLKYWSQALEKDLVEFKNNERSLMLKSLRTWSSLELAEKHSDSIKRKVLAAKFIRHQTVDQFDFDYNKSTKAAKSGYLKLHELIRQEQIPRAVFVGNTGLGKTHLARALGYAACQAGQSVYFTRASTIVNALASAKATHDLENELKKYRRPQLLIIDELGYVTMDIEAGNLFFQVVSDRHDRGLGTIVTTNFAFGHWNQIFASDSTAVVIVERLTAEAEVFYLEGPSYPQSKKRKN
jgi:DNA replication protein DnaC